MEQSTSYIIQSFPISQLSQVSYYIESEGVGVVVDPSTDIEAILEFSKSRGARISYIIRTHRPNNFISGAHRLSKQTSAIIVDQKVTEEVQLSARVKIQLISTPGYTSESICVCLQAQESNETGFINKALFSGNTVLFSGEEIIVPSYSVIDLEARSTLANQFAESLLSKVAKLQNAEQITVYPCHVNGAYLFPKLSKSQCDFLENVIKSNKAFTLSKELLIEQMLNKPLVTIPKSFAHISQRNEAEEVQDYHLKHLSSKEVNQLQSSGRILLDCRPYSEFLRSHVKSAVSMTLATKIELWMGLMYSPESSSFILMTPSGKEQEAIRRLARIGYDSFVQGVFICNDNVPLESFGFEIECVPCIGPQEFLQAQANATASILQSVDVRDENEFNEGAVSGSLNVPVNGSMLDSLKGIATEQNVYVFCNGGGRAPIACSILQANGIKNVIHVNGGMSKLKEAGVCLVPASNSK